ncbi:hypothetical protein V7S43_007656 [Phytophthora oleae]|uniref:TRAF-type domain-containing protein n=1 Tax=Phytophthora oleae TaxID=2107226 RepID=A0ABD3FNT6_9STRA
MDWEANLAAIIKCTDASLAQQFRQFEDVTAEFTAVEEAPVRFGGHDPSNDNVAATYLRETMAAEHRNRQQEQHQQQPRASYARVSSAFTRGPAPSAAPATTFSDHFHRRQERKRATVGTTRDNQRVHRRGSEYEPAEDEGQIQDDNEPRYGAYRPAGSAYHQQMYSSPTYDIAQMMEQVRLSLKLEVDARAAIAERQLSALLQLCKATSEELDRLRVEVCANDRQLHTLDQVQSKIRQELTTQKDIGFHLQSMCGKDESWRMQTENQLLELRQMAAALREQGNSTQAVAQEKLSRSELLVQFNAAMEPIKAQLQANLQHQAQQIADITRTTSSSSLLLDGITQKVNRGITDELSELRSDLNALKHHVAKMDIFQDGGKGESRPSQPTKEEQEAKMKEKQQQQENKLAELRDGLQKELLTLVKDYVKGQIKPIRQTIDESGSKFVSKYDIEQLRNALEEGCRNRCAAAVMQADGQFKSSQDQLRGECNASVRDSSERMEKAIQQTANAMTTTLEGRADSWQNKHLDLVKLLEREEKERKQALEELHESLRKSRHQLEDQFHTLVQESRTNLSQHDGDFDKRLKDVEKQVESAITQAQKENQTALAILKKSLQTQGSSNTVELEQKVKRLEETVSSTDQSVAALSKSIASLPSANPPPSSDSSAKDVSLALEKQTNVYVSTMENLLQKMQLQLQLQTQPQVQMMAPSPFHGFWPPSPYASSQAPPPPLLHLPATLSTTAITTTTSAPSVSTASAPIPCPTQVTSPVQDKLLKKPEEGEIKDKCDDRVRSVLPVTAVVISSPSLSSPPPVALSPKAASSQREQHDSSKEDTANTRENTLATTAKGALAEAELAKARVESRRKLEQEMKQQQQKLPPKSAELGGSGANLADAVDAGNRRLSVSVAVTGQPSVLTRSASSSALRGSAVVPPVVVPPVGNKPLAPASVPSTPTAARTVPDMSSFASIPPQTTRVEGGSGVPKASSFTTSSQNSVQMDSKPPSINQIETSIPPTAPKLPVAPAVPPIPKASTPSSLQSNNSRQDLTLSVASVPATDEVKPSLSPLAKMFARSTDVKEDLSPALSANISLKVDPEKKDLTLPTSAPPVSVEAPVSHVLCGLCRLPVRSDLKTQHEKELCPKRMVECVSCKQQLQWVNLEIHELECSTAQRRRTDTAISTKAKPLSDDTTATALDLGGSLKKCRHCSADIQSLDLLEHEINCDKVLKQCPHCLRRQKMSELQDHIENCDCRLVSCPNDCGGKFLQRGIPNHLATRCPKKPATTSAPVAAPASRSSSLEASKPTPPATQPPPNGKVECKFCDDEIEVSKLRARQL